MCGTGARRPDSLSLEKGRRAQEGATSVARGNVTAIATMKPSLASQTGSPSIPATDVREYFDHEVGIEERVLVDSGSGVSTRIAHHPRAFDLVVEAVMRMAMDPQLRSIGAEEMFQIRYEAC